MHNRTLAAALIAGSVLSLAGPAQAVPLSAALSLRGASTSEVQAVQWRRGWGGWGWGGVGFGLAAGAIVGAALAAPYYRYGYYGGCYNCGYSYGYGYPAYSYGYSYPSYSYAYAPAYYGYGYSSYPYYAYAGPRVRYRAAYRRWRDW